ncbi:hypothetical protein NDU88_005001 [Pleurodeles waltl]|uniref:Uncharacterized protein n=1 Tax=Pleurodeles waltl TaxID=8319 RepID=A0AAV7SKI6_PLEWA|nr:hypothetical protein NDU88_005001 [Pleurodeles waltl]
MLQGDLTGYQLRHRAAGAAMALDRHRRWTYNTPVSAKSGRISGCRSAMPKESSDFYEVHSLGAGSIAVPG